LRTSDFDFDLPADLIAQHPVEPRDRSRLLVIHRPTGTLEHHVFANLPDLLSAGDRLVRNNTRVVAARLLGQRTATGGRWEGLFLRARPDGTWLTLASTRGRPRPGETVTVGSGLVLTLLEQEDRGRWIVRPESPGSPFALLAEHGRVPLPPYIRKGSNSLPEDRLRYQTIYARHPGSVAAPTAGLHFTEELFGRLGDRGIGWTDVTLHVGLGTFQPITAERIDDHVLHREYAELTESTARELETCRSRGGRVVAVGTTSARVLETAAESGTIRPFVGETGLFLRPGHRFRGLDALITNFHLPRSSLLVLVASLLGLELLRHVYSVAISERYRFYSYGDAMLILGD
jgi:S-adenosylmethionine:tRNA ribosyltransferase-isomerase